MERCVTFVLLSRLLAYSINNLKRIIPEKKLWQIVCMVKKCVPTITNFTCICASLWHQTSVVVYFLHHLFIPLVKLMFILSPYVIYPPSATSKNVGETG